MFLVGDVVESRTGTAIGETYRNLRVGTPGIVTRLYPWGYIGVDWYYNGLDYPENVVNFTVEPREIRPRSSTTQTVVEHLISRKAEPVRTTVLSRWKVIAFVVLLWWLTVSISTLVALVLVYGL